MAQLSKKKCEACHVGASRVSEEEISQLMPLLPEWKIIESNGIKKLKKSYNFKDFKEALEFTNKVGAVSEEENHHPSILTEWGSVTVTWWTHKIKALHINDFIMAAKTEMLV